MTDSCSPLVRMGVGRCLEFHSGSKIPTVVISIPGNYQDGNLSLWSVWDYSLVAATSLSCPIHAHHWDLHTAYEFTTVGVGQKMGGVSFWMVEEDMAGKKCQLKVSREKQTNNFFIFSAFRCIVLKSQVIY